MNLTLCRTLLRTSLMGALALGAIPVTAASARRHAAGRTTPLPSFGPSMAVMYVGAHPDDEALVAPLLGKACVDDGARCSFLVATRGEQGGCALPSGCADLGATRAEEMRSAAALFRASLIQWTLADTMTGGPGGVRATWASESGGDDALISRMRHSIEQFRPTVLLTFDPAHGSSCHPAHRAVARLVLDAVDRLSIPRPEVWLVETIDRYDGSTASFWFGSAVTPATPVAIFEANTFLASVNDTAWRYLLRDTELHASQFSAGQRNSLAAQPPEQRRIVLVPATQSYVEYSSNCE
jgi:LmbE family N-acetylglucosaminyl deacetylase